MEFLEKLWAGICDFFVQLWQTLLTNPHILYSVIACLGVLLVLIVLLIILGTTKKSAAKKKALAAQQEDSSTSEEVKEEVQPEEEPAVEEVVEEETQPEVVEEPVAEEVVEEEPAAEEPTEEVVEEPVVEEVVEEEAQPEVIEEQPAEETQPEEVVEEQPTEEANEEPVKKPRGRKKKEPVVEEVKPEPVKKTRVVYGKYEVYTDGTSHYYTLKASNGEVLIKSEAYAKRESVLLAIEAIKRNVEVGTISVRQDKHGLYQFVLVAKNHRTLVMSANYATEKRATSASESFKRFASNSPVIELTEIVESNKEEYKPEGIVDKKGGKLSLVTTENGFYYTLKASNGEVLVHSDTFKTLISAENAMKRFKESVTNGKFYIEVDKRENYQFKLFAQNGRIVCVGQIYATKALAVASINSVCSFINLATRVDE